MAIGTGFLLRCAEIESADIDWVSKVLSAARHTVYGAVSSFPIPIPENQHLPLKEIDTLVLLILVRDDEELQNTVIAIASATKDLLTVRRVLQDHLEIMDHAERDRLYAHARLRLSTANTPGMGKF